MPKLTRDQGLVLAATDFAETDRIVSVLTLGHGKIRILAKGARRITNPSGAILDLLNCVELIYYERPGLQLLREASVRCRFPGLREDLGRLEAALDGATLAARLLPERQPNPLAFRTVLEYLKGLEHAIAPEVLGLAFRLKILGAAGFRPHLSGCVSCGAREQLTWSPERGGLVCLRCGAKGEVVPPLVWRTLEGLQRLPLRAAERVRVDEPTLTKAKALLDAFTEWQLER